MNFSRISLGLLIAISVSCKTSTENNESALQNAEKIIEVQGHRGDRGNFPENSIPAFISAVKKGVDVLELDVVISRDNKVVVSHEPYIASLYMTTPGGDSIPKMQEREYNLYQMSYDSIKEFDAGSRGNHLFPQQQSLKTYKPLLAETIDSVEAFISKNQLKEIKYNIELKSGEGDYGIYQPAPEEFVKLVMEIVKEKGIENRMNIQSFDKNILNVTHKEYPEVEIAYLVSGEGIMKNLALLNFTPEIYSPHFQLLKNEKVVDSIHALGMKLIPWTINEESDIERVISLGVDGIITDYPERVIGKTAVK